MIDPMHSRPARPSHRGLFRTGFAAALLVCGALLGGCSPGSGLPPLPATTAGPYQLGVDDLVRVHHLR